MGLFLKTKNIANLEKLVLLKNDVACACINMRANIMLQVPLA